MSAYVATEVSIISFFFFFFPYRGSREVGKKEGSQSWSHFASDNRPDGVEPQLGLKQEPS